MVWKKWKIHSSSLSHLRRNFFSLCDGCSSFPFVRLSHHPLGLFMLPRFEVSHTTRRYAVTTLESTLALLCWVLLLAALCTTRWVVVQYEGEESLATSATAIKLPTFEAHHQGLFRQCSVTPLRTKCAANSFPSHFNSSQGCSRSGSAMKSRLGATAAMLFLAFFLSLFLLVVTVLHFSERIFSSDDSNAFSVDIAGLKLVLTRKFDYWFRIGLCCSTLVLLLSGRCDIRWDGRVLVWLWKTLLPRHDERTRGAVGIQHSK